MRISSLDPNDGQNSFWDQSRSVGQRLLIATVGARFIQVMTWHPGAAGAPASSIDENGLVAGWHETAPSPRGESA
jgi:hypothetical protein